MNSTIGLLLLVVVGTALADTVLHPRGCIWVNGRCQRECEEGTMSYSTGCGHLMPEATCDVPNPKLDERGYICDFSACYCAAPTVRDTKTKKCVPLEECSK